MERANNDPDRVIVLFEDTGALQKQSDLGSPKRDDIKMVLELTWNLEQQQRRKLAGAVLKSLMSLITDDTAMLNIGFDSSPTKEDRRYMAEALIRFDGDRAEGLVFLKKVADIIHQGEELGHPSRDAVIASLENNKLDQRQAVRKLKETYRNDRDAQLKLQYSENIEREK